MRLLLDTNIFLEVLLDQERSAEARDLLVGSHGQALFASDYSIHTIGVILLRRKNRAAFADFMRDLVLEGPVSVISLTHIELVDRIGDASERFGMDFDDTYQYAVAVKEDLRIVSFDSDFDRTDRGRTTPAEILNS